MQAAFIEHDGFQCGYCTPGPDLLGRRAAPRRARRATDDEIREWMSGNLCRCGAYPNIVAADPRRDRPPDGLTRKETHAPVHLRAAARPEDAIAAVAAASPGAAFFAGGTTLLDLMKLDVLTPTRLVDINAAALGSGRADRRRPAHRRAGPDERRGRPP